VTWNVRDFLGDPWALRRVVRALAPDVLCLQEAPRRPGGGWRIARFARDCGLLHVAGGRASGGTALLVAPGVTVRWVLAQRLPVPGPFTRTRGLVVADLTAVPASGGAGTVGTPLTVACLHLPLEPALRLAHARAAVDLLLARPGPHVVAGDLNETPGQPVWQLLTAAVGPDPAPASGPTFPAGREDKRLDVVLTGAGLRVKAYGDGGADPGDVRRGTDHRPVVADLVRSTTP
jgi:endonuclease/exonuclease/phosphatase family metal-dependent hydrolase